MSTKIQCSITPSKLIEKPIHFISGPLIGYYQGSPIFDYVTDNTGLRRNYMGLNTAATKLAPGSIVIMPGLIYSPEVPLSS